MEQSFAKVIDLIYLAKQDGIEIVLNEERLQLKIPDNKTIDKNLLEEIRNNKSLIIDFLSNENWKSRSVAKNHNKITRSDREGLTAIPLSFSQERLWFIDQLEGSVQYNLPTVLRLKGPLNIKALSDALQMIVTRHEPLRTTFRESDGHPSQFIRDARGWRLNIIDGSFYQHDSRGLQKHIVEIIRKPFDLARDYMMRADLITIDDREYIVVVTMHHIASDAWSLPIIVREVVELYRAYDQNRTAELPPLEIQYADFAIWQRRHLRGDLMDKKIAYWREKLDNVAPLQLPTDFERPVIRTTKGSISNYRIDKDLAASIKELSKQQGASLFMVLLTAYKILLHRYSGQQDISVGTSIAGRQPEEVVGLIGFFANTLALRTEVNPDESFIGLLQKVKETTMEAYENQEVSFEKVVETVVKERDASRSPLFQVMLVLHNTPDIPQLQLGDVQLTNEAFENNISKFDITFFLNENSNGLQCSIQYRTDLFKEETISRMMDHFRELLSSIVKCPKQSIAILSILSQEEQQQLLTTFNDSVVAYPKDKTIVDLFEQQAAKTPNDIALVFEGEQLTYKQLNERSNQLAHYLRSRGVQEDSRVPLCVERSHEMMVGILGILKAGAAYVPIEPDFPEERKNFVLEDTAARVVVTSTQSASTLPSLNIDIIEIDDPFSPVKAQPLHNLHTALAPHHLAYVIYTSGSTGKPKGVMIEHLNLVDYVFGLKQSTAIDECRSYALVSSIATDLGNTVIYSSLVFGGVLHIFSKESVSDIEYLHDYFDANRIDCLKIVPSHWKALSSPGKLLLPARLIVFGGEALQSELIEQIRQSDPGCIVANHYGPTETTIGKLLHVVSPGRKYNKTIPIGKPFSNTRVYVLSKTLQLSPIGIGGELFIQGDGIARGYLNNPELTKEKFIQSPFDTQPGSLMYRTGDLVRWLADGNIEFIGRVDDQVKIRGYRVELGEIESILLQQPTVKQAIVLAKEDNLGNKRLVSYIVGTEDYDKESAISSLKERLPDYMIPGQWVRMDDLPLLPNGKIDRKSLPDPELPELLSGQYVAPRNETETILSELWKEVLEVDQVGVHDNFFELGGHSLLAVRLISAIRKRFVVELPIGDIFDYPTVALLSAQLSNLSAADLLPSIEVAKSRPERIPLSFSQERLWFIDKLEGSVQYHVPTVLRLKGKLNEQALEFALQTIINRHEVLRTVIVAIDGKPYQKIKDKDGWRLSVTDGSIYKEDPKGLQQFILQLIRKPFDLSKDYLLRATLIKIGNEDHVVAATMHHIASDAWSTPILVKEVVELYNSFEEGRHPQLTPLPVQYADYAIWQRNYLQGDTLLKKLNYWKNKLEGAPPLQLPIDFTRPAVQTIRGRAVNFKVDKETSDRIVELTQQQGATLFMTLLTTYKILLARYSGQQDIVVGTSIANRTQQDVEGLLGFFANTLALRTEINPEISFTKLLQQVKQNTIEAYEHQDVPFEKVVDAVIKERDLSRSPLFQAMMDLLNAPDTPEVRLGDVTLTGVPYELSTSKFDITFFLNETADGLHGVVQYRTDLFEDATITRMIGHFKQLLRSITEAPQQKIGALQMLTDTEKQQLLVDFNDTATDYDIEKTILDLFEEQVAKTPDNISVVFEDRQLTYQELNERSNQLAGYLRSKGIREEVLVPICIERSPEMLIGILGVLKAGGAYVPIDPGFPVDRINYLIEDTRASILLSTSKSVASLPDTIEPDVILIDDDWPVIGLYPSDNKNHNINPRHLAYVIYTSGSTGKPKGVMIEHQNLRSYLVNNKTRYITSGKNSSGTFVHLAYTFDASLTGLFMPLLFGKAVIIGSKESVNVFEDPNLQKYAPYDFIKITPSHLELLLPEMRTDYGSLLANKLVIGGEALFLSQFNNFIEEGLNIEIINEYGPTEATVGCSVFSFKILDVTKELKNDISIGKPIDNVEMYILDSHLNLLPPGVPGEIFIAGAGIARGYLNMPDLTAERFITNPFSNKWKGLMYKTGDLGRWLTDGNIDYLGRQDDQVKIRGYRIELGEIESVIQQNENVSQAVVVAKQDSGGNKKLVAYVIPKAEFEKESIIDFLKDKLPEYMVPTAWVTIENFPLTSNGKIDKKALPDPESSVSKNTSYAPPRNETEQRLADIWQELLEVEPIGIHDSFFELGGHSLLTVRLISAIRKEFGVDLPISDIFDYPTVALQASQLGTLSAEDAIPPIQAVMPRPDRIPLSYSQERLWFIDRLEGSLQYHVPTVLRLKGQLNRQALNYALKNLVNRHEVLRTVIREEEGRPYQFIMEEDGWNLAMSDGSLYRDDQQGLQRYIKQLETAPFDLSKDYVIRGHLIAFDEEDHVLIVTLHHIASDGWSKSVLVKELLEIYNAKVENRQPVLPELSIQFADFAIWQRTKLDGDLFEKKLGYWKEKLRETTPLSLPTDNPRPPVWSTRGASMNFIIEKEVGEKIHELSQQNGATLFMTLLAAFKVMLFRYSGQHDICVGTAIAGRQQQELEGLIGFFVNTLAFRNEISPDMPFTKFLEQVKKTSMEAYSNQEVPFEKVVDAVLNERSLSKNPLVQVMFALLNTPEIPELRLGDVKISGEGIEHTSARFDITFFVNETAQGLHGSVEYATDLYNADTIQRMIGHFKELLGSIIQSPDKEVGLLPMITRVEENQLLLDFNQTKLSLPTDQTLVDLFEAIVLKTPGAPAVIFEQESISYKELNERSNQLAHYLLSKGVTKEMLIPVCLERSINLLVAFLGILKSGAAYVPIDPRYPEDRIRFMLEDTNADMIISINPIVQKLPHRDSLEVILLDDDLVLLSIQPNNNPDLGLLPSNLVNVIYTSGSTGQPKGVMVDHKGMVNMSGWYNHAFNVTGQSRFTTMTGVGFDAFGFEIWPCLTIGAALYVVDDDTRLDTSKLFSLVTDNKITHCLVPTALIQEFVSVSKNKSISLQYLLCGGDKLSSVDIDGLNYKVVNNYGPTEYSIVASSYTLLPKNKTISPAIGTPIANTTIYIVNEQDELVPVGVAGEICLSGDSIARGYLNSEELTAAKFVPDPFSKVPGTKMYRTGDIGRWLNDGNIEYIQRKDDQVKIRGHRIELGEIESVLQQTGLVSKAVVIAKEARDGEKRLMSYLVPDWGVVKQKEHELYRIQVEGWKELYDTEYSKAESEENIDTEFNIVGWNDSFTKEPIPAEQMREWLDDIIALILSKNPGNVLEIGSGSGLIYYQLAGKVKKYIGTDLSRSSINQIEQRISKGLRNYGPTELQVCAAHEVSLDESETVDTVVINSVIQYFPGEDYLGSVIKKSILLLKGKGRIVIGDVRDNRLLRLFKSRLLLQTLQDAVSIKEFRWLVDQDVLNEEELCFSPNYFYNLPTIYPEVSHVEIQWKQSSYINELTLYRYNVVVHLNGETDTINPKWRDWNDITEHLAISREMQQGDTEMIALKNVPSHRLSQERLLNHSLERQSAGTVGDLIQSLKREDKEAAAASHLLNEAKANGWHFSLLPNEDPLLVNVLIEKKPTGGIIQNPYNYNNTPGFPYTNIPLFSNISSVLQREIRTLIQRRLPEYMVPGELMIIGDLPLTRNGKVDKKFLSQRKDKATVNKLTYEAPRTDVEQILANIWQDLLGIERIGIHENFFELGGHSLLATRTVSAVRKQLFVELFIKDLFVYPTIAELASHLGIQSKGLQLPALQAQPRPQFVPLSFSQERLWFIDRLEGSVQYHLPAQLRLKGKLDKDALAYALRNIINRHEVLRTVILEENGHAYQHILPKDGLQVSEIDGTMYRDNSEGLQNLIGRFINDPFDLSKDHMLRALLISLNSHEHILVVTMHHISSDGWSISIIVREVMELYNSYNEGTPVQLVPLSLQYADYSIWQRKNIVGEVLESKIGYWKEKLHQVAPLQLPIDYTRPAFQSTRGAYTNFKINKELSSALVSLSQQNGTTLFMTLLTAFKVLLHRYSGQQDICVGTPIAGRQQQEVEDLVGFFVNTLALRSDVNAEDSFTGLLQQVKVTTLEAYAHQELPFEKVVDLVVKERHMARSPLFQVMFIFQNTPDVPTLHLGDVQLIRETSAHDTTKFELSFNISQTPQGLKGSVEYCTDLYHETTISRIIGHYIELLGSIVQNPGQQIGKLRMLPQAEADQLLNAFTNSFPGYPKDKTIVDLIEEQVEKTPSNIAVVYENQSLTYQQLNERSNQLAHYLRNKGVTADTFVPVCLERSIEMIISIIGILKAGGAYIPIDPEYPAERILYMVEDTNASMVLVSKGTLSKIHTADNIELIEVDNQTILDDQPVTNLRAPILPEHLAYVIYTSGSTGKPKGVLIEHRNVIRLFKTDSPLFDFSENDVWSVFHSFCFDFSVWEMYGALFYGGKMVVVPKHVTKDVTQFGELILAEKVTILNQTPSAFYVLQDNLVEKTKDVPVRYVIFGGEALNPVKLQPWNQAYPNSKLVNMYGITETTVHVTYQEIDTQQIQSARSVIGKPIPTLNVYIVDPNKNPVPVGVAGEILVGGAGVARGYLNRPDLTAEKFISNPFSKEPGARLYRSGDAGAWLADGTIEYYGRIDEQVKIRGYRIELGEIESVLHESGLVRQAVVLAKTDKEGNKRLVGYVVPEGLFEKENAISYLRNRLPEYMVPVLWVVMENFTLTSNGKINKKALPDPDASTLLKNEYVAPRTELESALAEIWRGLLGVETVGIRDNFFELGGDSILTIQVVNRARRLGYELQPRDIFIHQTIGRLSDAIMKQSSARVLGEQGNLIGACGLTPIQQWFLEDAGESRSHFNQSVLVGIDKTISPEVLYIAMEKLVAQHDALRFKFHQENGNWYQEYTTEPANLVIEDLRAVDEASIGTVITQKAEIYQRNLDIKKGRVFQVVLMQTPDTEKQNRLLFVSHHLVIDGVSWRILIENLEFLLTSLQKNQKADLGIKTSSYRQWHEALCRYGQRRNVLDQSEYWEKVLTSYKPLAKEKSNAEKARFKNMGSQLMNLGADQTMKLLQDVPKVYHTEINDILICALAITLSEWGETDKVIIGMEGHGREEISKTIDTSQTVGWFTSLYPILIEMQGQQNVSDSIKSVKEQLRQVPGKGLGYGVLKYINKEKKLAKQAGWHIAFNYLGQLDNVIKTGQWLSGARESAGQRVSEEHLMNEQMQVNGYVQGGQLILSWIYNSENYDKESINELVKNYQANLELLIEHCVKLPEATAIFTPSDYGLGAEITYQELDAFLQESYQGIPRKDSLESLYRLSGLQQGMLFHGVYDERGGAYIDQFSCDLGVPNLDAFTKSWKKIIKHHSILRSAFYPDTFSIPVQCVYRHVDLPVTVIDYRGLGESELEDAMKKYAEADRIKGFDFKSAPLMRLALFRITDDQYRMLWTSHHLLFDGWSLPILMEEFLSSYELLISGKELGDFKEDRYEDYIRYIERSDKENEEEYWRDYMKGIEHSTFLPFVEMNTSKTKGSGVFQMHSLHIDETITEKIKTYSQNNRITVNTIMQGVWSYLLHQYTGNTDIAYGVVVSGRPDDLPGVEQRVGMFINTLPLHSTKKSEQNISGWLQDIQEQQVASRHYQFTPLQNIQLLTGIRGDLFDSILVFENYPVSKVVASGKWSLNVRNVQMKEQTNYPLTITIGSSDQINIVFHYNSWLLDETNIKRISNHFENVLFQLIGNEGEKLSSIKVITEDEEKKILEEFNHAHRIFSNESSIVASFEAQAEATPSKIAIVYEAHQVSYKELNERSNQLARYLITTGVQKETLVPVCIDKSPEMMIGILGILKAGGAFVPLDARYPVERINYIIQDTGASIILTDKINSGKLQLAGNVNVLEIDGSALAEISMQPVTNLGNTITANQLAYVMYTSGSTGRPKGVLVEHANVVSLVKEMDYVSLSQDDVLLSTGSPSFDATTFEYWSMLLNGGQLILCSEDKLLDAGLLKENIIQNKVTRMWFTSSWFNQLVENDISLFDGLKTILVGGEKLSEYHIRKIKATYPSIEIINGYGPTENTTFSLTYRIDGIEEGKSIPIGKPLNNRSAFILDEDRKLVPIGVTGEIYLGGAGVSRGYLNHADLTREKFIADPFSTTASVRLYRTGDLGRWLPDGNIEFLGRIDDQVKIRGFRIELEEINSVVQQSRLVSQSLIVAKADSGGNKRLVGYIVPGNGFSKDTIIAYLRNKLPEYMVPGVWVELETMPLNSNGKIDKKSLPDPEASGLSDQYMAPGNEVESSLANIWKNLLRIDKIGVRDNFFEVGGHSLLAMRLLASIRREFGVDIPLADIFDSTIESLAAKIQEQQISTKLNALELRDEADDALYSVDELEIVQRVEAGIEWGEHASGRYMIPIKKDGSKIPFFGIISYNAYRRLGQHMTDDQPLYYLPPTQAASVENIAAHYVKEIKQSQPSGPYLIGGFCGGGTIALEVVQQLESQGDKVLAMVLFETYSPGSGISTKSLKYKKRRFFYYKNRLVQLTKSAHSKFDLLRFVFQKSYSKFKKPFVKPAPPKFITSPEYRRYKYKPYAGKVILFQASIPPLAFNNSSMMGWSKYFTGDVDHIRVKGGHLGIFREPEVEKLAERLSGVLEELNRELKPH